VQEPFRDFGVVAASGSAVLTSHRIVSSEMDVALLVPATCEFHRRLCKGL